MTPFYMKRGKLMDYRWEVIDALEAQEKYIEALTLMVIEWEKNPEDLKVANRLGFLCWYVTVEADVLGDNGVDAIGIDECGKLFSELAHFGQITFPEEPDFLSSYGYMISLFPDYFDLSALEICGEYGSDIYRIGERMIGKARSLKPEDKIIQLMHIDSKPNRKSNHAYRELCHEVNRLLPAAFQGEGEMQQYFKEVLNRTNLDSD